MTDKERIEEMEELLNEYYENLDDPFASTDNAMAIIDKVGYFVKRVQELEEQLQGLHKMYDIRLAKSDEFEEQNKRYQEGIKLAMRKTDCDNTWDFLGRLLEGKEETDLPYRIGYKEEYE